MEECLIRLDAQSLAQHAAILDAESIYFTVEGKENPNFYLLPQTQETQDSVRCTAQLSHAGIKLSEVGPGTQLQLFADLHCKELLGNASLITRELIPTTADEWELKEPLNAENSTTQPFMFPMRISTAEADFLKMGIFPLQMEDKWFAYAEGETLHYFRSWTGIEAFSCELGPENDGHHNILEVRLSQQFQVSSMDAFGMLRNQIRSGKELGFIPA